jgi:FlaA1/EpsC-like NDP-sugar epimerase
MFLDGRKPFASHLTNIQGTKNIADLSCHYKVKKFVMVSTDKAVNPSNVMGASKRIAEKYVQSLHLISSNKRMVILLNSLPLVSETCWVLMVLLPLFTKQIAAGGPITITHPDRYFMTIQEACQLVLEAGVMGKGGEIYIFDMGNQLKLLILALK